MDLSKFELLIREVQNISELNKIEFDYDCEGLDFGYNLEFKNNSEKIRMMVSDFEIANKPLSVLLAEIRHYIKPIF
jgi:hypothetical protein